MTEYAKYPDYKSSEIDWLGDVPSHWRVIRIKHLTPVKRGASPRPIDDPIYFDEDGEFAWVRIADVSASQRYLKTTTQRLSEVGDRLSVRRWPGDLFLSIAGTVGKPVITRIKCCIHDGFVYFPNFKGSNEFLYYVFACGQPYLGLGKMGTQLNLNTDTVGSILIGLPPIEEQQAIVRFLDFKTTQIDALIAKKQTLLEKLTEKRTTLISHTVTKGLDPSAPMKDSGVEWLGSIPENWRLLPFRHLIMGGTQNGLYKTKDFFSKDGTAFIQMGEAFSEPVISKTAKDRVLLSNGELSQWGLEKGDLIFARRSLVFEGSGKCSVVGELQEPHVYESSMIRVRPNTEELNPLFAFYYFGSAFARAQMLATTKQVTISGIDSQQLKDIAVCVPPLDIQVSIVAYIQDAEFQYSKASERIVSVVSLLKEYRSALITNAVTGKIDVRGFQLPCDNAAKENVDA